MDIDENIVKLATLNMLLTGDGNAKIEMKSDGLGSIQSKFSDDGSIIKLVPKLEKQQHNYYGEWDNQVNGKALKKFDIVLMNPSFGEVHEIFASKT